MTEAERTAALHEIVDAMIGRGPRANALSMMFTPLDVSAPNQHPNKTAFLAEKSAVLKAIDHCTGLWDALFADEKEDPKKSATIELIRASMDATGRQAATRRDVETSNQLVTKNALELSLYYHALVTSGELRNALAERLKELEDQEKEFWSDKHRPPNHHARFVALRLARLYARERGEMPTVGAARDGGHPSTDFTRALEAVFKVADIDASVRRPAAWAVGQLTEDDLKPEPRNQMGGLLGLGGLGGLPGGANADPRNVLSASRKG